MPYLVAAADPRRPADPAPSSSSASPPSAVPTRRPSTRRTLSASASAKTPTSPPSSASAPAPRRAAWKPADVRQVVRARASGAGLWVCDGSVVALATGRVLARISGVEEVRETTRWHRHNTKQGPKRESVGAHGAETLRLVSDGAPRSDEEPRLSHSATLSVRDSLFYTAPDSNALLRSFRLRPGIPARRVRHVLPPASGLLIGRSQAGSLVLSRAPGGSGAAAEAADGAAYTSVRDAPLRVGRGMHALLVASWAFVGRRVALAPGSNGVKTPAVVERCDYALGSGDGVWNWSRVARCPSWYGRGQCVTYLRGRKVRGWDDVDAQVRAWMAEAGRGRLGDGGDGDGDGDGDDAAQTGAVAKTKVGAKADASGTDKAKRTPTASATASASASAKAKARAKAKAKPEAEGDKVAAARKGGRRRLLWVL